MSSFDYNAPAELFLAKRTKSGRKNAKQSGSDKNQAGVIESGSARDVLAVRNGG
jgi:hypothetical protein